MIVINIIVTIVAMCIALGNVAGGAPGAVDASRSMTVLTCDITKTHSTPKSANDHFLKEWSPNGRRV